MFPGASKKRKSQAVGLYGMGGGPRKRAGPAGPRRIAPIYQRRSSMRGAELKGIDTDIDIASGSVLDTTSTNGSMLTLNLISPGTASYNRIGRKIKMKSVRLKGRAMYQSSDAVTTGNVLGGTLRMVVVYDRQPSGSVPVFSTIFGRTVIDGTESSEYMDSLKWDNTDRFKVLRDVTLTANPGAWVNAAGTGDIITVECPFDEYIKLGGLETQYSGQSSPTTIADISGGALYVFFRSNTNVTNKSSWVIENSYARLRYYD